MQHAWFNNRVCWEKKKISSSIEAWQVYRDVRQDIGKTRRRIKIRTFFFIDEKNFPVIVRPLFLFSFLSLCDCYFWNVTLPTRYIPSREILKSEKLFQGLRVINYRQINIFLGFIGCGSCRRMLLGARDLHPLSFSSSSSFHPPSEATASSGFATYLHVRVCDILCIIEMKVAGWRERRPTTIRDVFYDPSTARHASKCSSRRQSSLVFLGTIKYRFPSSPLSNEPTPFVHNIQGYFNVDR